ncbi:MAG TPA: S9 family peptidase [Flavihumibacter sp.]|nr:S9 family peptidase [Flavihumibacter sp.]
MRSSTILLLLAIVVKLSAQKPIQLTDMLNIKTVGSTEISPDGSKAYFTLTSIEAEPEKKWEYQYKTQIYLLNTDGSSAPRALTAAKESSSQLSLSPDGKTIAFVRAVDGKSQIFLLPLDGGEAQQLTSGKYSAVNPQWSPDSKYIAFSMAFPWREYANDSLYNKTKSLPTWPVERPKLENSFLNNSKATPNPDGTIEEVRAWLQLNEKDKKAKLINRLNFQEESTTNGDMNLEHVFLVKAIPGATPKQLTTGFNTYNNPQFISNSNLLVSARADLDIHPDRSLGAGIYLIDTNAAAPQPFLVKKDYNYTLAAVSANGKWLAVSHGPQGFVTVPELAIMPVGGTAADFANIPLDRNKSNIKFKGDESVYGLAQSNGGVIIFRYDIKTKKFQTLSSTDEGAGALSVANNKLLYSKVMVKDPSELYTADLLGKNEKTLTSFNNSWLAQRTLSLPEKHSFKNEKGQTIEYWIMKPTNFSADKKFPLLLEIHGGPSAMWGPGEASMWHEFQYFAGKGYGVVYSNPRGSGGYGLEFLRANVNDWGKGPMEDVLHALDETVAAGWADSSKLFLTGGSYAGYLGAYILGHDHRFAAACSQRGVYDLRTFFGEGNAWRLVPNYFGGYPWQPETLQMLERESPISYVDKITTPYIIFHGENDLRTGVIQSEQLYKSLKVLGRPVEYVRHPGATHEITRAGNNRQRMDQMLRTWEFFERYR